jgi:hypothetical protein
MARRHAGPAQDRGVYPARPQCCRSRESRGACADYDDIVHVLRLRLKMGAYGSRSASARWAKAVATARVTVFARLNA